MDQPSYMPESEHNSQDHEETIIIISNKQRIYIPNEDQELAQAIKSHRKSYKPKCLKIIAILLFLVFGLMWLRFSKMSEVKQFNIPESVIEDKLENSRPFINNDKNKPIIQKNDEKIIIQKEQPFRNEKIIQNKNQQKKVQQKRQSPKQQIKQFKQNKPKQVNEQKKTNLLQNQKDFKEIERLRQIEVQKMTKKYYQLKALKQYHPWDLNKKAKLALLEKYKKKMPERKITQSQLMPVVQNRQKQILPILQEFQKTNQVVKYWQIKMTEKQKIQYQRYYNQKLGIRMDRVSKKLNQQKSFTTNSQNYYSKEQYKITRKQWYQAFQYHTLVGANLNTDASAKRIAEKQYQIFETKYKIGNYKKQLKMCIIAPGLNNQAQQRYLWHIESVLQQNYTNYRLIIVDDVSTDKTVQKLAKHLKWRNISQDKVILVKNNKSQKALGNIFYATHKYCDFGEVQVLLDSDDEFVGRQVLKVLNALYQKQKYLTLYSTLVYSLGDPKYPRHNVGISRDHLQKDVQNNIFRLSKHRGYSSLRTMLSDLFLLTKPQSLQDRDEKFYWIVYDNAYYYSALELSCGRIHYVPEIFYYYNMNTGINDDANRAKNMTEYTRIVKHIDVQKNYRCLAVEFMQIDNYKL